MPQQLPGCAALAESFRTPGHYIVPCVLPAGHDGPHRYQTPQENTAAFLAVWRAATEHQKAVEDLHRAEMAQAISFKPRARGRIDPLRGLAEFEAICEHPDLQQTQEGPLPG